MIQFHKEYLNKYFFEEIKPLLMMACKEVYKEKENDIMFEKFKENNIDYDYFLNKQNEGKLFITTIRDNNKLVGYWALEYFKHSQSNNIIVANNQTIYVLPEYRKNNISVDFIKFTEDLLKKYGVDQIFVGVNPNLKTDILFKRLKYSLNEVIMSKKL